MDELKKIGFFEVGFWKLQTKKPDRIEYEIQKEYLQKKEILYCFVSSNVPYYFGISDNTLKERMGNYKAGKEGGTAGSTNKKVHSKILQLLNNKKEVKILLLEPKYTMTYESFNVNIGKGIEHSLIEKYDSNEIWNDRGSSNRKKAITKINNSEKPIVLSDNTVSLNRGSEFNKGWIIFGNKYHDLLPESSCEVKLTIKDNLAKSYRFTHSGNNRKIYAGKDLVDWIRTLKPDDKVKVEIINPNHFKILSNTED
jgi:hypothetical protein